MYPVIPAELMHNAVQLVICFVTIVGVAFSVAWGGRA
jgi:hypothetical protein